MSGLVLAVFLGTIVAGILPAVEATSASTGASQLRNVLLDGFTSSPVCGNNVNCTGQPSSATNPLAGPAAQQQRDGLDGLPPRTAAALLAGLRAIPGATVVGIYSVPGSAARAIKPGASAHPGPGQSQGQKPARGSDGGSGNGSGPGNGSETAFAGGGGIISCSGLRAISALGQCAPGRAYVLANAGSMFGDNPRFSTQPIAGAGSPAFTGSVTGLYLQAVLVKADSARAVEQARTYLVTHTPQSQSGTAARTFGEAVQARGTVAATVERLIYLAVLLTLIVAGCSLAVTVVGSLVERKRPFTLLRLSGASLGTLYRVVLLEAVLPLIAAVVIAAGLAYLIAVLTVGGIAPAGTPVPVPGEVYFLMMGGGLVGALAVIGAALPLLGRVTSAASVRFE